MELFATGNDSPSVLYRGDIDVDGVLDLYFSRDNRLFADGFESGDTSRWSNATP